ADVGIDMKNLDFAKKRIRIASMKIPCHSQTVLLRYKTPEVLKRAGLPLYDADRRREIPLFELELAET
ncbi:MAG: hypothetical protein P8Y97_22035, partial [Candidatus Lokiarchaeota archaeon]